MIGGAIELQQNLYFSDTFSSLTGGTERRDRMNENGTEGWDRKTGTERWGRSSGQERGGGQNVSGPIYIISQTITHME